MEKSEWIALGALIVAVVGLIPQFNQAFASKSTKKKGEKKSSKSSKDKFDVNNTDVEKEEEKEMSPMMRILMLTIFAFASFLIEIIIFSIIAYLFGVDVNFATMSLIWKVSFCSLFLIPGVFLFLAFLAFVANTE